MSRLRKIISENIVEQKSRTKYDTVLAKVVSYNNITNRASVEFEDAHINSRMYIENVPVQLGSGGVHSAGPFEGDEVFVSFQNGSPLSPKIVALADETYNLTTRERLRHKRKGALLPSKTLIDGSLNYPQNANLNTWILNNESDKYSVYKYLNPIKDLEKEEEEVFYYSKEDPGITHPLNSSTVRIRKDGSIDIFVATNEGIKINPKEKSITFLSGSINAETQSWKLKASTIDIEAKENINIKCKKLNVKEEENGEV